MNLNQILQEKFPHLELSVLKLSEAQRDNETKRIDSEYFKKEYLENEEKIKGKTIILNFLDTKIQNIKNFNLNKNFNYLQISDIDLNNGLTYSTIEVDFADIPDRATYILQKNDICVSTVRPNRNAVALIKKPKRLIGTSGFCVLRLKEKNILPEFLYIFCKTYFFITKMMRANTASLYPAVLDSDIYKCKIPLLPMPFQLEIEKLVKDSHLALEQSKALYKQAEDLLYTELGLNPQNPMQSILQSHSNGINFRIATLKESFLKTGRLDSEYYQVKYEEIETFIQSYQGGFSKLEIVEIKDSNFTPKDKEKYRYIELANIGSNGNISAPLEELGEDLPTRARRLVKEGDLIVSSVEGSLSSCALITKEFDNCIVSTGFYVLKSQSINSETLLVLFKSKVFQDYLKKFPSGTILTAISKEELQNILIPKIDFNIQKSIAQHIQTSFTLRTEAKNLLNTAKQKVEYAIKNGGGANHVLFVSLKHEIFRIYYPQIRAKLKESKAHYRLAEWLLYAEILFDSGTLASESNSAAKVAPPEWSDTQNNRARINYTIHTLKQSLGTSGRLDSEYYQAKYKKNENLIQSKPHAKLGDIVIIKKSIEPGSEVYTESGIPFIRVSNLASFGISSSEIYLNHNVFKDGKLESLYPKKDTILLSKDGSIGIAYCVEKDMECVTSGAILHLQVKDKSIVLPQYLALILNSCTTQLQAQRDSGGSIIAHWKIEEIKNVLIPLLDIHIQKEIESKIAQSFALRAKSKNLLENAKSKLENTIHETSSIDNPT